MASYRIKTIVGARLSARPKAFSKDFRRRSLVMADSKDDLRQFYCVCPIENGSETGLPSPWHESVLVAVEQDKARIAAQGHRRRRTDPAAPVHGSSKYR